MRAGSAPQQASLNRRFRTVSNNNGMPPVAAHSPERKCSPILIRIPRSGRYRNRLRRRSFERCRHPAPTQPAGSLQLHPLRAEMLPPSTKHQESQHPIHCFRFLLNQQKTSRDRRKFGSRNQKLLLRHQTHLNWARHRELEICDPLFLPRQIPPLPVHFHG